MCFRCSASSIHVARHCKTDARCEECDSNGHVTALHYASSKPSTSSLHAASDDGGEIITNKCSEVSGQEGTPRSCSKICLVRVYLKDNPSNAIKTYVLLDDQSNGSFARSTIFTKLGLQGDVNAYTIKTTIPGNLAEVPTPEVAESFQYLKHIASKLPPLEENAEISILLGGDAPKTHKVRELRNGPDNMPWAQRLDLGWVVIGEVCVNDVHKKNGISTCRTEILLNGRPSRLFEVCRNHVEIQDSELFKIIPDDEKTAMSTENRKFVEIMNSKMKKDENGNWEALLPFKEGRNILPNNKPESCKLLQSLIHSFQKRPKMKQDYFEFMGKIMERGHTEAVNDSKEERQLECWYFPHFEIYHPKKPEKIRVVFHSSAESKCISLNDVLLSGPDLVNSLHGVLVRFREDVVPIMADIEEMFKVSENHRDFLRFLWYRNNDPAEEVVTYRMKVHIFGNKPSPAVATFGFRKTAEQGGPQFGEDARRFVDAKFYVDDGLKSVGSPRQAIDLLRRTKAILATANIRLQKIVSIVTKKSLRPLIKTIVPDLREWDPDNNAALQRSLGVYWNVSTDLFTFKVSDTMDRPNTKRRVLSEINSVFDPLQFAAPVTIEGKALLREMTQGWDDPLPQDILYRWNKWRESLSSLFNLGVARPYTLIPAIEATGRELHVFSDALNKAIGAVCYLGTSYEDGKIYLSFVAGKAKLAPKSATSVRLELCGAVLAVDLAAAVLDELSLAVHETYYYTDSKVVLCYIRNEGRRFYTYVANRVVRMLQVTTAKQWNYVRTDLNPADEATRSVRASDLHRSRWLMGPAFLHQVTSGATDSMQDESIELENDPEVRREITCTVISWPYHKHYSNLEGSTDFRVGKEWFVP
ncbi:uncharacterized protein LOC117112208 [Anneissia japonica]|uniref:uncharacterized protein LOC117112208 n=1 Tax=Anneissia japonica TaxID=1529436 RepID=UPI0014259C8D|nr:uncharacterized protein LOC117112208 [Anneissia japonica]